MATYASIRHNFTPPSATTSAQVGAGAMTLIKSVDASSDATISFVDGTSDVVFDNTYKTYIFKFINMHGSQEGSSGNYSFDFNGRDGSTAYDAIKTSTSFIAYQSEAGDDVAIAYNTGFDHAQQTAFQKLAYEPGIDNDQGSSGELWIFNPSSTTFVKHWLSRFNFSHKEDYTIDQYIGGYFNVTAAIDAIQFKWAIGDIDTGTIKLYGIA